MSLLLTVPDSASLLLHMIIAAGRTVLLAGLVGLLLKVLSVKNSSIRLIIWKAVLVSGLLMPLVMWWVPSLPIVLPGLPSQAAVGSTPPATTDFVQPTPAT